MPPKQKHLISQKNTRTETEDRILGQPCALNGNVLPTYLEVGRAIKHKQTELQMKSGSSVNPPFKNARLEVATQVATSDKFRGTLIVIQKTRKQKTNKNYKIHTKKQKKTTVNHHCQVASPGDRSVSTVDL